jgi:response regulator RpfG family c-di-GMP phosphodiesterase
MSPKEAFDLVMEGEGSHFDPAVIEAFVGIYGEIESIARHEARKTIGIPDFA